MIVTSPYAQEPEGYLGGRSFGLTIRGRRMAAGLTLRACAEQMGVSMSRLSRIETGMEAMTEADRSAFENAVKQKKGGAR